MAGFHAKNHFSDCGYNANMENIVIRPDNLLIPVGGLLFLLNLIWLALRKPFRFFAGANLFAFYLVVLISLTVLPFSFSVFRGPLPEAIMQAPRVNLDPFGINSSDVGPHFDRVDWLNIAAFIPFGFLLPFTTRSGKLPILLYGLIATLAIESTQLILTLRVPSYSRAFDVNDIITNLTGALLGYWLSRPLFLNRQNKN